MLFFLLSSLPFFLILGQSELRLKSFNLVDLFIFSSQPTMATKKLCAPAIEDGEESAAMSFLDLPELTMEIILGKLSPAGLCNMARVCSSMRERCKSDFLWERHMKEKWGCVIGSVAQRNWQCYLASARDSSCGAAGSGRSKNWVESLACFWPLSWLKSRIGGKTRTPLIDDSIMSWYLSLESGKFWFPAQVFNRENGHVGFMLSCYDAELCYDSHTDTFQARYPPHGRRTIVTEEGLQWDRLRVPPLDTSPQDLHVSDCLNDLRPGDHIEIQWRRNKEFPYGWWYGVVGHLESCDGNEHFCRCSVSDTVVLEFNQYASGSRWRRACVSRKDHQEEGNEADGFYGGIRKLHKKDEITTWKRFWQTESSD